MWQRGLEVQPTKMVTCLRRLCFPLDDGSEILCVFEGPRTFVASSSVRATVGGLSGDGAIVDPAARLVCVAFGSWRLVSRNDETSHESDVRMLDSAEKLVVRLAPHFLWNCVSLVAMLEAHCLGNPDQDGTRSAC